MVDDTANLILTLLRRADERQERMAADIAELKTRMTAVEAQLGHFVATEQLHYAVTQERFDGLGKRIERVERRLDLLPAG